MLFTRKIYFTFYVDFTVASKSEFKFYSKNTTVYWLIVFNKRKSKLIMNISTSRKGHTNRI